MDGKFAAFIAKFKEFFGNLSAKTKKLLAAGLVLLIVFAGVVTYFLNNKPYDVLFTGLNEQESTEIMGKLQESGVPYQFETGGTLLVPKEQAAQLKAKLAFEGYPKSGFTYNIFKENIGLMTTESERESYKLFDLQDRIAGLIRLFDGVKDAKVTIVLGEDRRNVLDSENATEATASVVVIMKDGGSPTKQQVEGIQRLVSRSTPQLKFGNIVVTDGNGHDVSVADESSSSGTSRLKMEVEKEMSEDIRKNILNVLEPIYGAQNLRVSVKCTVDVDKKLREIINYSAPPNEEDKTGIPGSVSAGSEMIRGGDGAAGGVVGTQTNAQIPNYGQVAQADGTETYLRNQNDINYLVDQIKEQAQIDSAALQDLTISVAINGNNIGTVTRNDLTALIANAAGVATEQQNQKIAIVAAPFYQEPTEPEITEPDSGLNYWIIIAAGASAVLLFIILLVVILANKRKKRRLAEAAAAEAALHPGEAGILPVGEDGERLEGDAAAQGVPQLQNDLLNIQNEKSLELKENIRRFAEENPEIAAQLIRSWLRGGEHGG